MTSYLDVPVPAGGVELCVQEGRRGRCCPDKPSFDHAKPDALPLSLSEWAQFQTKVQNAIAGMKSERAVGWLTTVPAFLMLLALFVTQTGIVDTHDSRIPREPPGRRLEDPEFDMNFNFAKFGNFSFWAVAIAMSAVSVGVGMWVSSRNRQQDELIRGACSELTRGSGGRLTAEYHTFYTGVCQLNKGSGRGKPHRVIVLAPSQQVPAVAAVPVVMATVAEAQPGQAVYAAYATEP